MASTNSNTANNGTNADSSNGGGRVRQHEEPTHVKAPYEGIGTFRRTFQSSFISKFTGQRCQLQPVEYKVQRVAAEESVAASLQTHPKVQMHPLLQRNAMSPTNASKNSLLNMLATKHEASVQRAMKEDAEGGQSGEREPQAVKGPITYTLDDSAKGKWNNTGLVFRHVDGKPLTSEEVYRFIRDEKAAGNTELQELLPMRADAWYKERGQEPPRFTIENSQHTYYGYAGNGGRSPSVAEGPGQDGRFPSVAEGPGSGGPTLPILDWPKAPDYQNFGSPADRDNRDSYQIVQGYYVLTRATNGGDRYYFLPVTEKGNPQPNWTPFTPKGLAAKQARDADPMGYAYMRGIADGWTGLVEADYTEIGHTALDYIGMVPIIGEPADMINAVWYAAEGNYLDAFLSSGAAVPMAGYAFNVIKNGRRAMKIFNRGGKVVVETVVDQVDDAVEGAVKVGDDVVEEGAEQATKSGGGLGRTGTGKDADFEQVINGGAKQGGETITYLNKYKALREQLASLQRTIGADKLNQFKSYLETLPPETLSKLNANPSQLESFAKRVFTDADYAAAVKKGDLKLLDGLMAISKVDLSSFNSLDELERLFKGRTLTNSESKLLRHGWQKLKGNWGSKSVFEKILGNNRYYATWEPVNLDHSTNNLPTSYWKLTMGKVNAVGKNVRRVSNATNFRN